MKGNEQYLNEFLDGAKNRFIIPVYQRNYDWSEKQCEQLFNDLVETIHSKRQSHFFGSIVSTSAKDQDRTYIIIDGQQRITTISLLYIAMINLLKKNILFSKNQDLAAEIEETYIVNKFSKEERKLRLKPTKDDCDAFDRLVTGNDSEFIDSNITTNYFYFYNRIQQKEITVDELYDAISKLQIIGIFVAPDENPQLIFESLNSTGLALSEADKIRNFILMGLESKIQDEYYNRYWNKIEKCTSYHVSEFIRNYLTVKQKEIPRIDAVYVEFKNYVQKEIGKETKKLEVVYKLILEDMLHFANIYKTIVTYSYKTPKIAAVLKRLNLIDMSVTYPFLLILFYRLEKSEISEEDVLSSMLCLESYIFRRIMCGYPTNSLNKIFSTLDSDVMRQKLTYSYADTIIYILEHKNGRAAFPNDEEFKQSIKNRDVYHMQQKDKKYIFDRLENTDTVERVNVIEMMGRKELTIEHIMPQTLSPAWKQELGENWEQIFNTRLNTLPNLTLTGYNSKYSNNLFQEKKTCEKGFKESGLNLNKILLDFEKWTEDEMDKRWEELSKLSLKLWEYPETNFIPKEQQLDEITLEDSADLTKRKLISFTYGNSIDQKAKWVDMFIDVTKQLYVEDYSVMHNIASANTIPDIQFSTEQKDSDWKQISSSLYLHIHNDTNTKIRILNRLFDIYDKDKSELIFKLEPLNTGE